MIVILPLKNLHLENGSEFAVTLKQRIAIKILINLEHFFAVSYQVQYKLCLLVEKERVYMTKHLVMLIACKYWQSFTVEVYCLSSYSEGNFNLVNSYSAKSYYDFSVTCSFLEPF